MLRKKIFKILSVLVAVIIAFCSFTISASADTYEDFDFNFFFLLSVYDSEGNIIDEIVIPLEDIKFNSIKNSYYFDVSAPVGYKFFEPGSFVCFEAHSDSPLEYFVFSFPSGVLVDFSLSSSFGLYDDFICANFGISATGQPHDAFAFLISDRQLHTLSFAFAPAIIDDTSDNFTVLGPKLQPGMFDFYSNINIFFKQSVSWLSNIFKILSSNSALFFVVVGFPLVGFVFAIPKFLKG